MRYFREGSTYKKEDEAFFLLGIFSQNEKETVMAVLHLDPKNHSVIKAGEKVVKKSDENEWKEVWL